MTMPENSAPGLMVLIGAILTGVGIAALGSYMVMRPRDVPEMLKLGASLLGIGVPLLLFGLHGRRRASTQTSSDVYKRYQGTGVLLAAYGLTMVFSGPGEATGDCFSAAGRRWPAWPRTCSLRGSRDMRRA